MHEFQGEPAQGTLGAGSLGDVYIETVDTPQPSVDDQGDSEDIDIDPHAVLAPAPGDYLHLFSVQDGQGTSSRLGECVLKGDQLIKVPVHNFCACVTEHALEYRIAVQRPVGGIEDDNGHRTVFNQEPQIGVVGICVAANE
jgi:hypothetical protein